MSKLTAAIELLDSAAVAEENDWPDNAAIYRIALRILEAAEGVDKDRAIRTLSSLLKFYVENSPDHDLCNELEAALNDGAVREIRALLESLPNKEK